MATPVTWRFAGNIALHTGKVAMVSVLLNIFIDIFFTLSEVRFRLFPSRIRLIFTI